MASTGEIVRRQAAILASLALVANIFAGRAGAGSIEVKLGTTVERSWEQVKADKYDYGPKQEYDAVAGETHIYLPYGTNSALYDEVAGALADPAPGSTAMFNSQSGSDNAALAFKLHFDQRIGALRFSAGWAEIGVAKNTVAGAEYSEDGRQWKTISEVKGSEKDSGAIEPLFKESKAAGLNTDTLYIRLYTRDPEAPQASGPGRWLKLRMSGDPSWGDAATTFFSNQLQVWVTPVKPGTPPRARPAEAGSDDASAWGIASGAEWMGDYPKFNPMLDKAGVRWLRAFPEWQTIQPAKDRWNWTVLDAMVADAQANHIKMLGIWAYLAPWASADGGTRKFPIKDIQYWRDYVSGTVGRYKDDITYWEVWNEFNGSFGDSKNKVKDYAELAVTAYDAARKANPDARIGLSVANFDVGFLDAVIKAGAADHFDFICVHPYENLGAVAEGGEAGYLSLAGNLRKMLAANKQKADIPLWITEVGEKAPIQAEPKRDAQQADMLAKAYILSIAQGFSRIFWFEARGPSYGGGADFGIIRPDWTPRPSYDALKTLTTLLGPEPHYIGWLDIDNGGYGFAFQGHDGPVMAAWSPAGKQCQVKFDAQVRVTDLAGKDSTLPAGEELTLTRGPVFLGNLPASLVKQAEANRGKEYPWGGNYAKATVVTCRLGAANVEEGLKQVNPQTTVVVNGLVDTARRTDFADASLHGEGHYVYFRVDPRFVPYGTTDLEITVTAKRMAPDKKAGMALTYESLRNGYTRAEGWWTIPDDDQWHENTWTLHDANFVGQWGWNFRFDAVSSPNEFMIKEVRVKKTAAEKIGN
jgi:hypothetical protein